MTFLLGFLRILKAIPWQVWTGAILIFGGWYYADRYIDSVRDEAFAAGRAEVLKEWAAETAQEDAEAIKAKTEWNGKVAAQAAEIQALQDKISTDAETYRKQLASARRAADSITREVSHAVRSNPLDPAMCSLPPDVLRLRTEQIRQANFTPGGLAAAPSG